MVQGIQSMADQLHAETSGQKGMGGRKLLTHGSREAEITEEPSREMHPPGHTPGPPLPTGLHLPTAVPP